MLTYQPTCINHAVKLLAHGEAAFRKAPNAARGLTTFVTEVRRTIYLRRV